MGEAARTIRRWRVPTTRWRRIALRLIQLALVPVGPYPAAAGSAGGDAAPTWALASACPEDSRRVCVDDPQLMALWTAAIGFDRLQYGFSALPGRGTVIVEDHPDKRSAVIHTCQLSNRVYRAIHFRPELGAVRWIGEQQVFRSGRTLEDRYAGTLDEELVLTYEIEPVAGFPPNRLNVDYRGPAGGGAGSHATMSLDQVRSLLRRWGF